jgi:hypothetical protein
MGSSSSRAEFAASYAPTARANCKKCKGAIKKGELRLSRDVANNWTGDKGSSTFHYHLGHGMDAVAAVRCMSQKNGSEPVLAGIASLNERDAAAVQKLFATAKGKWQSKCRASK